MAHQGIKGTITSTEDGKRIRRVRLFVKGHEGAQFTSNSDGIFWRILLPGNYTMLAEADNFVPTEVQFEVAPGAATRMNFSLEPMNLTMSNNSAKNGGRTARNINVNILSNLRLPELSAVN